MSGITQKSRVRFKVVVSGVEGKKIHQEAGAHGTRVGFSSASEVCLILLTIVGAAAIIPVTRA